MKKILIYILVLCSLLALPGVALVSAQGSSLSDIFSELISNPIVMIVFLLQIGIGFGLGYFTMKALKYILAIFALLVAGVLLNIWQFGTLANFFERSGIDWTQLLSMIQSVFSALGILSVLPLGLGFCLGIVAGAIRK